MHSPEKHRRYQVYLTASMVVLTACALVLPHYTTHTTLAGLLVNLAWLWEG